MVLHHTHSVRGRPKLSMFSQKMCNIPSSCARKKDVRQIRSSVGLRPFTGSHEDLH